MCRYCGNFFVPDPRVGNRQKACSIVCQRLRKKENNRVFTEKNPGYWSQRYEEVKQWRQRHPDYQRRWREAKKKGMTATEIQAERRMKIYIHRGVMKFFSYEIQVHIAFSWDSDQGSFSDERDISGKV